MTVKPISDEQLAELEEVVVRLTHGDWWVDWNGSYIEIASPSNIKSLIARLRAAEVDAKRWRHARDILTVEAIESAQSDFINFGLPPVESESIRADQAIDSAMESTP